MTRTYCTEAWRDADGTRTHYCTQTGPHNKHYCGICGPECAPPKRQDEDMKAVAPAGIQCPECGVPQPVLEVVKFGPEDTRVRFDCCGAVLTAAAAGDAFGIDLPPPTD